MPGETSLYLTFTPKPEILEVVKQCDIYYYHKKIYTWEVPLTSLHELLDKFCLFDQVQLDLLEDNIENIPASCDQPLNFREDLYPHQIEGILYGLQHPRWLLLDAPGLGKTLTAIRLAEQLKTLHNISHCLIICGINTLKTNWKKEISNFSNLSCKILGERVGKLSGKITYGGIKERLEDLNKDIDEFFVVTNIQTIRDSNIVSAIKNGPNKFDMIVVDEIHTCVSGDTLINTDRGLIKIKCINQNDNVLSYNVVSNSLEYKKVLNTFKIPNSKKLLKLTILDDNGFEHSIKCTPEHKIYTHNRGFVEAQFLTCDDRIEIIKN